MNTYNKLNILKNLLKIHFKKNYIIYKNIISLILILFKIVLKNVIYIKECVNYQKYLFENSLNNNNYNNNYDNYNTSNNFFTKSPIKTKRTIFKNIKTPIKSNNNTSPFSKSNLTIHNNFLEKKIK